MNAEKYVKQRNAALVSMNKRQLVQCYIDGHEYANAEKLQRDDEIAWAGCHKARITIAGRVPEITPELVEESKRWLVEHGFQPRGLGDVVSVPGADGRP